MLGRLAAVAVTPGADALARFKPDAVLSSNTPLVAQRSAVDWCGANDVRFVFWQQDALGIGIRNMLTRRYGRAGTLIGGALGSWIGVRTTLYIAAAGFFLTPLIVIFSPLRTLKEAPP